LTGSRTPRNRAPGKPADPVRRAAYQVVRQVNGAQGYGNLVLGRVLREARLTGRDAAFCTELVHGTLRWQGTYDEILARCVTRPINELDPDLLDVLRLGTHQLLRMRVGSYAAVSETVTLARAELGQRRTGLVNAVLRKVSQRSLDQWVDTLAPAEPDHAGRLAVAHAHPRWVVEAFADALGGDLGEVEQVLAADNEPPRVTLVARPGLSSVDELLAAAPDAAAGRWSPYAVVLGGGDPGGIAAVAEGRAGVQDEGSQLVALALAEAPVEGRDARWLDLCAGPGGKSALLAAIGVQRDAVLTAVEPQQHRAQLVRGNLRAVPGAHRVLVVDGTTPTWAAGSFDRVLADVPCTGLGALRRRPEARWRRTPADVEELRPLQERLLAAAIDSVRPGGVVAYVTCSPHQAETRAVVDAVAGAREDVVLVDARPLLPGVPDLGDGPDVQLWPHRHGTDAMYLALMRRS
jgi:16S rRNA (cytosine967-C5)-methyltransferase